MNFWKRLFAKPPVLGGIRNPDHPARGEIDHAVHLANAAISFIAGDVNTTLEMDMAKIDLLASTIDAALDRTPEDTDLLMVKAATHLCAMRYGEAERVLDAVCRIDPEHFQANQSRNYPDTWRHVLGYPNWSETDAVLHPAMAAHLKEGRKLQLVRDGLCMGMAVVFMAEKESFPKGLHSRMRAKWEPVLAQTPHGDVMAHYLMVADDPKDPYIGEAFLPTYLSEPVLPEAGYWLIQTLAHLDSCFLVISNGADVFFNIRYVFPEAFKKRLREIAACVRERSARMDVRAFKSAAEWHMMHFSLGALPFSHG